MTRARVGAAAWQDAVEQEHVAGDGANAQADRGEVGLATLEAVVEVGDRGEPPLVGDAGQRVGVEAVTLDYAVRRLAIGRDASTAAGVPLFWEGGVPLMPARVGGIDAMMLFDTGAGGEVLCARFAERFRTDHLLAATTRTAAGTVPVRLGLIQPLQIGGAAAIETRFAVKPCVATGSDTALIGCDGMIGGTWMAGRRLTIDADRLTLRFDGA